GEQAQPLPQLPRRQGARGDGALPLRPRRRARRDDLRRHGRRRPVGRAGHARPARDAGRLHPDGRRRAAGDGPGDVRRQRLGQHLRRSGGRRGDPRLVRRAVRGGRGAPAARARALGRRVRHVPRPVRHRLARQHRRCGATGL
ncbi:MAG: PhnB protein; putative DNA binding 3-demethylubiquinone-9 3-methyltransferase domain protein, partial [uncultured Nocardioides sp.]